MKLKSILTFGLAINFLAMSAADQDNHKLRVINQSGYEIELKVDRQKGGDIKYAYPRIENSKELALENSSQIKWLGVRFTTDSFGYPIKVRGGDPAAYSKIDVSDLSAHSNDTLVITIEAGYGGYGAWDIKRNWIKGSEGGKIEEGWEDLGGGQESEVQRAEAQRQKLIVQQKLQKNVVERVLAAADNYAVLGVPEGAKKTDIRKAYLNLMRDVHPDKNPESLKEKATEAAKKVQGAYEKLK